MIAPDFTRLGETNMPEKFLTTAEACEWLGVSHEALAMWRARAADPLPAMRAGKAWRYSVAAVTRWLERQGKRAVESRRPRRAAQA
jgi:excisionase family DNA binding protein